MNAGTAVIEAGGGVRTLALCALSIDTTDARLDIADHAVIVDYTGASPLASVKAAIKNACNNGAWKGFGITSSLADASVHGVGFGEAGALGISSFAGETLDGSTVLVKYTYYGDATSMDRSTSRTWALATNWQSSGDWTAGDFNYDGFIDVSDLGRLATNWQAGVGSPLAPSRLDEALAAVGLSGAIVPEPAAIASALIGALVAQAAWPATNRMRKCHV